MAPNAPDQSAGIRAAARSRAAGVCGEHGGSERGGRSEGGARGREGPVGAHAVWADRSVACVAVKYHFARRGSHRWRHLDACEESFTSVLQKNHRELT